MTNLTVDGKTLKVPAGATILEAARDAGVTIPTLCHHEALSAYGACRLCLVEVDQGGRVELKTSCNNVALDGMVVKTDTPRVLNARKFMVELLLSRCPTSEKVLEIARQLGVEESRFPRKDDECILCGLCVRMCHERMGKGAISFAHRGTARTVGSPFDKKSIICQTCGACVSVCPTGAMDLGTVTDHRPVPLVSSFDAGLAPRSPIHIPYPQAVPNWPAIDRKRCVHLLTGACKICEDVCEAEAVDFTQEDRRMDVDVGAIVLTPGFEEFLAQLEYDFGYSRYADVVSSMEFERILSASGPFGGHVQRLSDGKEPRKLAFLQCVGSRDIACRNRYCSSVCCMYAIKEAVIAKEHLEGVDVTIFFMDIRAFGKEFDKYYERARSEYGVKFVRARVSDVFQPGGADQVTVKYAPEGGAVAEDQFDMVVLSAGMEPPAKVRELAGKLGVRLEENGFFWTDPIDPLRTSRDGVFVGGAASGPKDIPETVTQASGAAGKASQLLSEARNTLTAEPEYPPERDVTEDEPRIGVFVCHCGINIGGVVDVPAVTEYAETLPDVAYAENNLYTCSQDTQEHMREMIINHSLNRVIVTSCSPRTHEPLFRNTLREAGLNPYLFEMANIRDQCSWVHMHEPEAATAKAKDLLRMAVAKSRLLESLYDKSLPIKSGALVVGGGLAGMTSALSLAQQGFDVNLVEREDRLGGNLVHLHYLLGDGDPEKLLRETVERVNAHPNITVRTGVTVGAIDGFLGNFTTKLTEKGEEIEIEHGTVIVATGGAESTPTEYLYGESDNVITQRELEQKLSTLDTLGPLDPTGPEDTRPSGSVGPNGSRGHSTLDALKSVVMIQCVGSREEDHMYCSRICCGTAVKNALKTKELSPETEVYVLYRDMRTYGFSEEYFEKAREKGVLFVRFDVDNKPVVSNEGGLAVTVVEPLLDHELVLHPDLLVLSGRIDANSDSKELAQMLKVPLNEDGFFLEAHMKLRPVEFATEGVFLAGLAHAPKSVGETIAQAEAAASRAATVLSKDEMRLSATVSEVVDANCDGCAYCIEPCPYNALTLIEYMKNGAIKKTVERNEALCKGCGVCMATCPKMGVYVRNFKIEQINAMVGAALEPAGAET